MMGRGGRAAGASGVGEVLNAWPQAAVGMPTAASSCTRYVRQGPRRPDGRAPHLCVSGMCPTLSGKV